MGSNVSFFLHFTNNSILRKKINMLQGAREKALQLLREVPRLTHGNIKGLPEVLQNFNLISKINNSQHFFLICCNNVIGDKLPLKVAGIYIKKKDRKQRGRGSTGGDYGWVKSLN